VNSGRDGFKALTLPRNSESQTMNRVITSLRRLTGEDGQDLLEYAMLVALIAVVAVGAVTQVGNTINSVLWEVIAAASF
jgi:Flp pilus assembly pilin Flp